MKQDYDKGFEDARYLIREMCEQLGVMELILDRIDQLPRPYTHWAVPLRPGDVQSRHRLEFLNGVKTPAVQEMAASQIHALVEKQVAEVEGPALAQLIRKGMREEIAQAFLILREEMNGPNSHYLTTEQHEFCLILQRAARLVREQA